ncbi:MAG: FlgD immunoglobulin-like domain containing protein [bacterium]
MRTSDRVKYRWEIIVLAVALSLVQVSPVRGGEDNTVSVGDTATFWSWSGSYFSSGYFRTEAVCRAVGEKCYIFVENDRWDLGDVDSSDVATILDAFENSTVAVDSSASGVLGSRAGIYDKVTSVFGQPPDFDSDPRIYILVMDVRARGWSGWQWWGKSFLGPLAEYGYFDPVNEYSARVDTVSNEHELLYLDCLPTDPTSPTALASLAHSLQRMIHWYNDPNEERWLAEGCSMLAQFLCGYGVATGYFPPMDPFVGYSGFPGPWSETQYKWEPNEVQNSMLMHFYFERYGLEFIRALAADNRYQGVEAINVSLEEQGYSKTFSQIFEDFALTWYFLSLGLAADTTFWEGRYSLKYLSPQDVKGTVINSFFYWCLPGFLCPPFRYTWTSSWSASFIAMTATFSGDIDSILVFNGEDGSEYSLVVIKAANDWLEPLDPRAQVEFIPLDSENRGYCDVSGYKTEYKTIYMAIVTRWLAGEGALYISDDVTPPDSLEVAIFHGPIDDRSLDIYVFSSEELISGRRNIPLIELTQGALTDTVMVRLFRPSSSDWQPNLPHIYHGDWWLSGDGVVEVKVAGQDVSGNHAPEYRTSFTVEFIPAKTGGRVASCDGRLILDVPAGSFAKDTWVTIFSLDSGEVDDLSYPEESFSYTVPDPEGRRSVGKVYRIGPTGAVLEKPAVLIIGYNEIDEGEESELAVYWRDDSGWKYVGGEVNSRENSISVLVDKLGEYQIQIGPHDEAQAKIPSTYQLGQNYPNPFNTTTIIRYTLAGRERRAKSGEPLMSVHTTLKIYNILGQEVRTLVNEPKEPGYYTVQWDGKDRYGDDVASGVYFYRLTAAEFGQTRKMVVLR